MFRRQRNIAILFGVVRKEIFIMVTLEQTFNEGSEKIEQKVKVGDGA